MTSSSRLFSLLRTRFPACLRMLLGSFWQQLLRLRKAPPLKCGDLLTHPTHISLLLIPCMNENLAKTAGKVTPGSSSQVEFELVSIPYQACSLRSLTFLSRVEGLTHGEFEIFQFDLERIGFRTNPDSSILPNTSTCLYREQLKLDFQKLFQQHPIAHWIMIGPLTPASQIF